MKILVAGIGMLGSQVAYTLARELQPEKLILYDIKSVSSYILDLQPALKGLEVDTEVTSLLEATDYLVITAGRATSKENWNEPEGKLYADNIEVVREVMDRLYKPGCKVVIMTNPVLIITEMIRGEYPNAEIYNPEKQLMRLREGRELGAEIIKGKGYTDDSAAVSCMKLIRELEESK